MTATDRTTFPLETLTETQREVFSQFVAARRNTQINLHEPISLALVLARERPATELTILTHRGVSEPPPITIEAVAETFDLEYEKRATDSIDVARTRWRFDLLSTPGEWSDARPRRAGVFYGYPPADIEHYLTSEPPDTQPAELIAKGVFSPEEIAYTTYLPQRHDDSIAGYERAIETGKTIRTTIADLANMWNVPALEAYAEWLYQDALTDCVTNGGNVSD